jgi:hypothetical protein
MQKLFMKKIALHLRKTISMKLGHALSKQFSSSPDIFRSMSTKPEDPFYEIVEGISYADEQVLSEHFPSLVENNLVLSPPKKRSFNSFRSSRSD